MFYDLNISTIIIGNKVQKIPDSFSSGLSNLSSINIPNSVTTIGGSAFSGCSGLTSVTIGNSVMTIGNYAFSGCTGLNSVNITDIAAWCKISFGSNPLYYAHRLFLNDTEVTNLIIPDSVSKISNSAFSGCSGLTSVTLGNSVSTIGGSAFSGCSGLTSITIGDSVTSIGNWAFENCTGLTSVTLGNSVMTIGNYAFSGCTGLNSVTCLAETPPSCGSSSSYSSYYAFTNEVTSQATLYVPMVSVAAYQAAFNWKDFSLIVGIPLIDDFEVDGVWYRALDENTAMVISRPDEEYYQGDVVIPEAVTYQDITFSVTAIDESAFEDCYDLSSVVIGDAVESIGENAFQGCTGLTSVTIGSGVTSIGAKAFNYCNALQMVTCRGTVPPAMTSSNCFSTAAYNRATLIVPRPEIDTYAATDYWYKFSHIEGWGYLGPGDVNGDGKISMDDLTRLISIMVADDLGGTDPTWADVNGNGMVNMNDLTALINLLVFGHQ